MKQRSSINASVVSVRRVIGGLLLLVALAGLAWDILDPDVPHGTEAAKEGYRIGAVIGTALRTLILSVLGAYLVHARPPGGPPEHGARGA